MEETPRPRAMMKGTVMGPVVTLQSQRRWREVPGDKGGKGEHDQIEAHQETVQGDPEQDAQQGDDKEDPHPTATAR